MVPQRLTIDVPEAKLEDLRQRLRSTAWAPDFGNEDWRYGVERGWLQGFVDYWANRYDWRAAEAQINAFNATCAESRRRHRQRHIPRPSHPQGRCCAACS